MFKKISTGNKISYTEAGGRIRPALAGQRGGSGRGMCPLVLKAETLGKQVSKGE